MEDLTQELVELVAVLGDTVKNLRHVCEVTLKICEDLNYYEVLDEDELHVVPMLRTPSSSPTRCSREAALSAVRQRRRRDDRGTQDRARTLSGV